MLGYFYARGLATEKDLNRSFYHYQIAADMGNEIASGAVGEALLSQNDYSISKVENYFRCCLQMSKKRADDYLEICKLNESLMTNHQMHSKTWEISAELAHRFFYFGNLYYLAAAYFGDKEALEKISAFKQILLQR